MDNLSIMNTTCDPTAYKLGSIKDTSSLSTLTYYVMVPKCCYAEVPLYFPYTGIQNDDK